MYNTDKFFVKDARQGTLKVMEGSRELLLALDFKKLKVSRSSIADLPQEILVRIVEHLDEKSRQRIRLVCTRWKCLIDEIYKIKIKVNNANWDYLAKCDKVWCAIFWNWNRDFYPQSDFTKHLVKLDIWKPGTVLTFYNMMPLLEACVNLKSLGFSNMVNATLPNVEDVDIRKWEESAKTWYPNLKKFKFIDNWESIQSSCGSFNYSCCSLKLDILTFMMKSFSSTALDNLQVSLKNSYFWFPLKNIFHWEEISRYERDYHKRRSILVPVEEMGIGKLQSELGKISWSDGSVVVEFEFYKKEMRKPEDIYPTQNQPRQIKAFYRKNVSIDKIMFTQVINKQFLKLWRPILERQFNVTKLSYEIHLESFTEALATMNNVFHSSANSLKKVIISVSNVCELNPPAASFPRYISGIYLSRLTSLTHLSINHLPQSLESYGAEGCKDAPKQGTRESYLFFPNLSEFPSLLTHLEIFCPIHRHELCQVFSRFTHLSHLKFILNHPYTPWFTSSTLTIENPPTNNLSLFDILDIVTSSSSLKIFELYSAKIDIYLENPPVTEYFFVATIDPVILQAKDLDFSGGTLKFTTFPSYKFHQLGQDYYKSPLDYSMIRISVSRNPPL